MSDIDEYIALLSEREEHVAHLANRLLAAERVVEAARKIAEALYVEPERIHLDLSRATVTAASALADALAAFDAGAES